MTRHEAVEEGEKTHIELVLAARQGGSARQPLLVGTCGMPAGGLWDEQMGHVGGGAEHKVRGAHTDEPAGRQSRRHAGEPEGGNNTPRPLAWFYAEEIPRVERNFFCHHD